MAGEASHAEPAGDAPRPVPERGNQYRTIQALRFVAAFAVVVLHVTFYTHERLDPTLTIYDVGANGVRLFFVISGFVMIVSSARLAGRPRGWSVFMAKRIIRIVPVYWAVTALKVAVLLAVPSVALHSQLEWAYLVKSLFFIPAVNVDGEIRPIVGVGWTLNFEMFFYLLFAAALWLRVRPLMFLAPILVGIALLGSIKTPDWPVALQFWCDPIVLDFLAGMLIARWAGSHRALPPMVDWLLVLGGLAYLFVPVPRLFGAGLAGSLVTTAAAAAVIVGSISLEPRIGARIPGWVLFMGAASYSLYLIHPTTAPAAPQLLAKLGIPATTLAVIGGIVIAVVAAIITYRFVEVVLTRLAERWARARGLLDAG